MRQELLSLSMMAENVLRVSFLSGFAQIWRLQVLCIGH